MKKYMCNPLNINYRYQFNRDFLSGDININREAADPSMIYFKEKYYIFASMTLCVWVSDDLIHWESHKLPEYLPLYGYAPDIRIIGDYVYYCSNKESGIGDFYRTKDIINGPYEKIQGSFNFSDPNLFEDEDGRVYFYWGLSCVTPIYGCEIDPRSMQLIGEKKKLIFADPYCKGFERVGEDNAYLPCTNKQAERRLKNYLHKNRMAEKTTIDSKHIEVLRESLRGAPFIEGAWMNKYRGKYYLQYAFAGTQYNTYGDGVYVSDKPLGPFTLAKNNPFSYKPGGFAPGAGHGSTMWDKHDNVWHAATMRISKNHRFERRLGIWPAGIDSDGELFCNQRYGDWPMEINQEKINPWCEPKWYLLSYHKPAKASSFDGDKNPEKAVNEDIQSWWRASGNAPGEWLEVDLQKSYKVHAVQINFADDIIEAKTTKEKIRPEYCRYIEEEEQKTCWVLEGSLNGRDYFVIKDKSEVRTDLSHDLVVDEKGIYIRFVRLTIIEVPYYQKPCISGLRIFGCGNGEKPSKPIFNAIRAGDTEMDVKIAGNDAVGYNILWGHSSEKLYHNYMVFEEQKRINALVKDEEYYVRVDAFNENGITEGTVMKL